VVTVLLVHGGLWDDTDADLFWRRPGVVDGLRSRGFEVRAVDRLPRAASWAAEADHLAALLPQQPVTVVAGSNGCSAAVRLALAKPDLVEGLLLGWPATAGDRQVDAGTRRSLIEVGAPPDVADTLLAGQTLRGVTDDELATIQQSVGVLPALPANPVHQRRTVDALLRVLPGATELPGYPEPPRPSFRPLAESFAETVSGFLRH
jgi:pimeloyl-ACP methyl ester carboxylesterase